MTVKIKELLRDKEKLTAFLKKNKWILLTGLCGLILLCLPTGGSTEEPVVIAETEAEVFSAEAFEQKLEAILSEIDGAGRVRVMLTLAAGTETVYATDETAAFRTDGGETVQESERTVVMRSAGGSSEPVEQKRIYPQFSGAIVVCDGADKASVELMILSAVSAATGLPSDRISVLPRK